MKPNLRPVFTYGTNAEANYLLREKQYLMDEKDLSIAKHLVKNKIENQLRLLRNTRRKDEITTKATYKNKKINITASRWLTVK